MTANKLFGNHITPACKYCNEAFQQSGDSILCLKKGVVPPDHSCNKFTYDPIKRIPEIKLPVDTYREDDFRIS